MRSTDRPSRRASSAFGPERRICSGRRLPCHRPAERDAAASNGAESGRRREPVRAFRGSASSEPLSGGRAAWSPDSWARSGAEPVVLLGAVLGVEAAGRMCGRLNGRRRSDRCATVTLEGDPSSDSPTCTPSPTRSSSACPDLDLVLALSLTVRCGPWLRRNLRLRVNRALHLEGGGSRGDRAGHEQRHQADGAHRQQAKSCGSCPHPVQAPNRSVVLRGQSALARCGLGATATLVQMAI